MSEVNILMLGGVGSGKTCFFLGMYEEMRFGHSGFTFSAVDSDQDRELAERWRILETGKDEKRWPVPSGEYSQFDMYLNFAMAKFMEFRWVDYPGGTLPLGDEFAEKMKLQQLVDEANSILICLPGDVLFDVICGGRKAMSVLNWDAMLRLMYSCVKEGAPRPSVSIVVTKFDLFVRETEKLRHDRKNWGRAFDLFSLSPPDDDVEVGICASRLCEGLLKEKFADLFVANGYWDTLICPVTLGMDFAEAGDYGEVDMVNMYVPVLFAYLEWVRSLQAEWKKLLNANVTEARDLEAKFFSIFMSDKRKELAGAITDSRKRLELFEERRAVVERAMPDDIIIYRNGVRECGPDW